MTNELAEMCKSKQQLEEYTNSATVQEMCKFAGRVFELCDTDASMRSNCLTILINLTYFSRNVCIKLALTNRFF